MPRDEPSKLRDIVRTVFASDDHAVVRVEGATARVVLDAGAQDDCAAIALSGDQCLVATSDFVRGVGFDLFRDGYLNYYDLGWYLAGANLSDIAAMGAKPVGLLSVVRYERSMPDSDFEQVLKGVRDCCAASGTSNIGGDIGGADRLVLSATALGVVEPARMLERTGAMPGDLIGITGPTGLAAAARHAVRLQGVHSDELLGRLLAKWRRVTPRLQHGRILGSMGATACVDTSDGLRAAIELVASMSRVGAEIDAGRIPMDADVVEVANVHNLDLFSLVFGDSVDFELLFTIPPDRLPELERVFLNGSLGHFIIGTVSEGGAVRLVRDGEFESLPGNPWRH